MPRIGKTDTDRCLFQGAAGRDPGKDEGKRIGVRDVNSCNPNAGMGICTLPCTLWAVYVGNDTSAKRKGVNQGSIFWSYRLGHI